MEQNYMSLGERKGKEAEGGRERKRNQGNIQTYENKPDC